MDLSVSGVVSSPTNRSGLPIWPCYLTAIAHEISILCVRPNLDYPLDGPHPDYINRDGKTCPLWAAPSHTKALRKGAEHQQPSLSASDCRCHVTSCVRLLPPCLPAVMSCTHRLRTLPSSCFGQILCHSKETSDCHTLNESRPWDSPP